MGLRARPEPWLQEGSETPICTLAARRGLTPLLQSAADLAVSVVAAGGAPAVTLARPALGLALQAALARALRRLGGGARPRDMQRAAEALLQAAQRQVAVARLAAGVLGDRADDRSTAVEDPALLIVAERAGGGDVEAGLDARGGHVGVLAA